MIRLAFNASALLVRINDEYWFVTKTFDVGCYESKSETYTVEMALKEFVASYGDPTWIHERIKSF